MGRDLANPVASQSQGDLTRRKRWCPNPPPKTVRDQPLRTNVERVCCTRLARALGPRRDEIND